MADIRGLPLTSGAILEAVFNDPAPQGFSTDKSYTVLCMAIDCTPVPPKLYVLLINDSRAISYVTSDAVIVKTLTPR